MKRRALVAGLAAAIACLAAFGVPPVVRAAGEGEDHVAPPFVTTPEAVVERMLRLAGTGPADTVMDLGSGDGRIVIAAAKSFGARGIGVEIEPRLVELARVNAQRAGVAQRTEFHQRDVLKTSLAGASVVTVYLLPFLIDELQPKFLKELKPGARIVTHAFAMKGWPPDRSETVELGRRTESTDSKGERSEIHLWIVPAEVRGRWEGGGWRLSIHQNFQQVEIEGRAPGGVLEVASAKLRGEKLEFSGRVGAAAFSFRGAAGGGSIGGDLTLDGASTPLSLSRR